VAVISALALTGCGRPHVSPLAPPPYRAEIPAGYARTWGALVKTLARENLPLRVVARDSGVIASDDFVTPSCGLTAARSAMTGWRARPWRPSPCLPRLGELTRRCCR
jgi:hypothetical protein